MTEEVVFRELGGGKMAAVVLNAGEEVSCVETEQFVVRYGAATVECVYAGGVETQEAWRGRGLARRLITVVLERARAGGAAFALLYGIGDFYQRFGFATLGAEYGLALRHPEQGAVLPEGWRVRPAEEGDLPAIRRLYDADAASGVMTKERTHDDAVWGKLAALVRGERAGDECRVVQDTGGDVAAYAWLGRGFWTVDHAQERYWPSDFFIGEVIAGDHAAADAVLAACRLWATEEAARRGRRVGTVRLGVSPRGAVTAAGQYQEAEATSTSWDSAGPQVRTLSTRRLLAQIAPELSRRVVGLRAPWQGRATLHTSEGSATVRVTADGVSVSAGDARPGVTSIAVTQQTLIRLVLGAFPPAGLLARTAPELSGDARSCLLTLFPQREPFLYPLDR